ncbi:MAG: GNAT family N-acetyltransferase, partial [Pseudonocardiaceae bacterium]
CRVLVAHPPQAPLELVACGVGWVHQLLPAYWLINGKAGYLQSLYTSPGWRDRGIASEIARQLIEWLRQASCTRVQLHADGKAAAIYRRLGFEPTRYENFWLRLPEAYLHPLDSLERPS